VGETQGTDTQTSGRPGREERERRPDGGTAAEVSPWAVLDERARGTSFVDLPIASILNAPEQSGMPFWSLNPYVGCEFGCSYCFARYAHRYVAERGRERGGISAAEFPDFRGSEGWEGFERRIFVKREAADVLGRTLRPSRLGGASIAIGTATDPYQPAERRFHVTRQVLERLAQFHGLRIGLVTKSPLVVRDIEVLRRLATRHEVTVHLSLVSVDVSLVRRLEPRSPMPPVRLVAVRKLVQAGIPTGVMIAPVLPGITDGMPQLKALVTAAQEAGAAFLHVSPLRLYAGVRQRFLPLVAKAFPELLPRYERAFDASGEIGPTYRAALEDRVERIKREVGFVEAEASDTRTSGRADGPLQWELPL
jgi:DNA repair photolyase